jgi:hypothetical protein
MSNEAVANSSNAQQYLGRNAIMNAEGLKSLGSDATFSLGSQGGQRQTIYEVDQRPQTNEKSGKFLGRLLSFIFHQLTSNLGMPRVIGGMHFLNDVGAQRRRNLQIKKRVVLSPSKDDKGDYLESGRGEPDD